MGLREKLCEKACHSFVTKQFVRLKAAVAS